MRASALLLICTLWAPFAWADQLVFGSFKSRDNAANWAARLTQVLGAPIQSTPAVIRGQTWYRVHSDNLGTAQFADLERRAGAAGVDSWRLIQAQEREPTQHPQQGESGGAVVRNPNRTTPRIAAPPGLRTEPNLQPDQSVPAAPPAVDGVAAADSAPPPTQPAGVAPRSEADLEWDFGVQGRGFFHHGAQGQDREQASLSMQMTYHRSWDDAARSVTFTPFARWDSLDDARSHWDVRELFYSRVGDDWDLHIGAKRVFWGVTEFHHLVDIVNQTDLLENIDTEDKLGQPMLHLSLVREWGIVDLFALTGFREREFPGSEGRLRVPFPIRSEGWYESSAEQHRVDAAVRWSHNVANVNFALHHFSGTSREPMFLPQAFAAGLALRPYYPVIDQTGIEAQALYGDWAFKLEGFTRSGFGDRYAAANIGFERTVVGAFGTRADLGVVVEYMFDERGDDAFNTIYESDIALGVRFQFNDFADTQALLGVIWDTARKEHLFSLEASRQISDSWSLNLETRIFSGGERLREQSITSLLTDADAKSSWLQRDDYLQLELIKYL